MTKILAENLFNRPLIVMNIGNRRWETYRSFTYSVGGLDTGDHIIVPKGFQTDFASVPRVFWRILPPDGQYTQAAVLHDYLYNKQDRSRKECDDIFFEAMGVLKVDEWKRVLMYHAVRTFGWLPWGNKRKRIVNATR